QIRGLQMCVKISCQITTWATNTKNRVRSLAHSNQVIASSPGGRVVELCKLRYCMPATFIYRAANFATLKMDDGNIHVSSRHGAPKSLVTIADNEYQVGP